MAFLDIWAAYDTVDRNLLWDRLRERGTPERVVRILARLGRSNQSQVIGNNRRSRPFQARAGVQQGGTLSPHLYNVLIDTLCEQLEQRVGQMNNQQVIKMCDGKPIGGLMFADDVCLVTSDPQVLEELLGICKEHSRAWRYRWKPGKSETVSSDPDARFQLYGEEMVARQHLVYLGVPIAADGIIVKQLLTSE